MKNLVEYLRCSSSNTVNCPSDCPFLTEEEIEVNLSIKGKTVIDSKHSCIACDIDKIAEAAADYIELLQGEREESVTVYAKYFNELKKDLREYMKKEKKYRKHDLRKDPNDLPEDFHEVLIYLKGFEDSPIGIDIAIHNKFSYKWITSLMSYKDEEVIAWREIEPFEEV